MNVIFLFRQRRKKKQGGIELQDIYDLTTPETLKSMIGHTL